MWNRHKAQLSATSGAERVPVLWASDLNGGAVLPGTRRAEHRYLSLCPRDRSMVLRRPAVLVQRTTAPEQPRRLVAAVLDATTLETVWGGAVVVENHVNVLHSADPQSPLGIELLAALLSSGALDRLYRCLTGTVAVSAYELEALPLPPPW